MRKAALVTLLLLSACHSPQTRNEINEMEANGVIGKGKTSAQDRLCLLAGTKVPLKPEVLRRLYKSKDDYVGQVDRRLKELVDAGWFLPEYTDAVRADARKVTWP